MSQETIQDMSATDSSSIESLIHELGGCGLFQVLVVIILHGAAMSSGWATSFMIFGNYNPGWTCNDTMSTSSEWHVKTVNYIHYVGSTTGEPSSTDTDLPQTSCEEYTTCNDVIYSKEASTIVTEWNLSCEKSYILSLMLFAQSGGYTIGLFIAGVLSNTIGRKLTHCLGLALHTIVNVIAVFSIGWPMFTVCRFFIGISSGFIGVSNFMYPMEFVTSKWRAIVSALPVSSFASTMFALTAMAVKDWKMLHLLTAVISAAFLVSAFWIPESVRWLTLKGYTDKATNVIGRIAKWNRKEAKNIDAIHSVNQHERNLEKESKRSSFLDLYRHGLLRITVITSFTWVCILVCYTVVIFDIKSLSGNLYVNMMLFSLIPTITLPFMPVMANNLGRRLTSLILFGLSSLCCAGLLILDVISGPLHGGIERVAISILFMVLIDAAWSLIMLYVVELYPTSIRSLGYSHASCLSRIGGMLASFLVPYDEMTTFISHIVMLLFLVVSCVSLLLLPETKDRNMEDYESLK